MKTISKIGIQKLVAPLAFSILFIVFGCEKDNEKSEIEIINEGIYEIMEDIYLWNDNLPDISPSDYDSPQGFLSALRYQPLDKWSYIITTTEFNQYFEQGEFVGHGFLISLDDENKIRIGFVYKNTQAYQQGVRRSWIIKKVNGTDATADNVDELLGSRNEAITNKILFIDKEGNEKEVSLTKETIKINAVLHSEVIEHESLKIGYIVFQEFILTANEELEAVFEEFTTQSVDELIIDLRYNGGGMTSVAEYLASWVAGNQSNNVFYKLLYNEKNDFRNVTVNFSENNKTIDLDKVYFITTNSSASASELLINGLKPYLDVKIVGTKSNGKPVGMHKFSFNDYDYTLVPICFRYVNANDEGDFYNGLPVDYPAEDDKNHDFGDLDENSLKVAINAITNATTLKFSSKVKETSILLPSGGGINQFLRAY